MSDPAPPDSGKLPEQEIPTIRASPQDLELQRSQIPHPAPPQPPPPASRPVLPGARLPTPHHIRQVQRRRSRVWALIGSLFLLLLVAGSGAGAIWWLSRPKRQPRLPDDAGAGKTAPAVVDEAEILLRRGKEQLALVRRHLTEKAYPWERIRPETQEAIATLTQAVDAKPDRAAGYLQRADAKLILSDYAGAIDDASRAVQLEPKQACYLRRGLARLDQHMFAHRMARLRSEALPPADQRRAIADDFRAAERSADDPADAEFCGTAALMLEGNFKSASDIAERVCRAEPATQWYRLRAVLEELQGEPALATADLNRCLERQPGMVELYLARALALRAQFEYEGAERDATICLRVAAEPLPLLVFRAEIRLARRDYRSTIDDCRSALDRDSSYRRARLVEARCRLAMKDFVQADATAGAVLNVEPGNVEALLLRSEIRLWKGEVAEGERLIGKAIDANPSSVEAYIARCDLRALKEDFDGALQDAEQALKLAPRDARALSARGDVYRRKGEHDKALSDYRAAKMLNPLESRAHVGLAYSLADTGEPATALEGVRQALRGDPKNPDLLILKATLNGRLGEVDQAFLDIAEALRLDANNPDAYEARARLWLQRQDFKKFAEDLTKAVELRPRDRSKIEKIIRDSLPKPPPKPPEPPKTDEPKPPEPPKTEEPPK